MSESDKEESYDHIIYTIIDMSKSDKARTYDERFESYEDFYKYIYTNEGYKNELKELDFLLKEIEGKKITYDSIEEYENRSPNHYIWVLNYDGNEFIVDESCDVYKKENFNTDSKCIGKMFQNVIYFNCNYDDDFVLK